MKASVSAIIAVYNPDLSYLKKAVLSVLGQTYSVKELVLVNDGGSDLFRDQLPNDPRIKVFTKQNEGVAATRNYAIDQCTGEYIAFLDQDDFWYPDKLMKQLSLISHLGEQCMVTSSVTIVDSTGDKIQKYSKHSQKSYRLKADKEKAFVNLIYENFIFSSTPLIHNAVLKRIGGFDPLTQPHDDWDMYIRIMIAGYSVYFYKLEPLSVWRSHCANGSNNPDVMLSSKCRLEKKLLGNVTDDDIRKIVEINLLIDYMERDNLFYKKGYYARFRVMIKYHLFQLLRERKLMNRKFYHRVYKLCIKSWRRYLVSYILEYVKKIK